MTKDEALKLALKFVEDSECGTADLEAHIKEALAQRTWVGVDFDIKTTPTQRTWVGLTKDEQNFVYRNLHNATSRKDSFWVDFANAIEAQLKKKNT